MMNDEKVLESHLNLTGIRIIIGFKGRRLALWMKEMKILTSIFMVNCRNCTHLPPLGDLPLLKSLHLRILDDLEYIAEENEIQDENSVRAKFPSLEELILENIPNLKGLLKEEEVGEIFPDLQSLIIRLCPLLPNLR